ncbi:MAG TPA: hypothetical protein VGX91_06215 [Candidatus Cybelea sp.]|jgi:hypothetical protein|nr:hypothetical protein [Candidatus Cybelea sp.]
MVATPAIDAYEIWLRTRSAVTSATYPSRIGYTIDVSGLDGSKPVAQHYRAVDDQSDGEVRVFPISDEELAAPPPVPHGVNFNLGLTLCIAKSGCDSYSVPAGKRPTAPDLLGVPLLTPAYAFGMRYRPVTVAAPSSSSGAPLRVIATVSAQAPDYRVTLIDTPAIDGVATYHLGLVALRHPKDNRLRELWVGESDFLPRRAVVAGNFTLAPLVDVPWTVDFTVVDGAPYIERESAGATLYMPHRRVVHDAAIGFQDIHEPERIYGEPLVQPDASETTTILTEPG